MLYLLEERLPIEAERLTVEFLPSSAGRSLGLAVETATVKPVVDELRQVGIAVNSICPTSLLTLADCLKEAAGTDYVLVFGNSHADLFRMNPKQPVAWYTAARNDTQIIRCIKADMISTPIDSPRPALLTLGTLDPLATQAIASQIGLEIRGHGDEPALTMAARTAASVATGRQTPWANFAMHELAPSGKWSQLGDRFRLTAISVCVFLAIVSAVFFWRATRYDSAADDFSRMQVAEYSQLFPQVAVPPNVRSRLASELSRRLGTSGQSEDMPHQPDALQSLRSVMEALPGSLRLRITQLRVTPTEIFIDGQARSGPDAEAFSQALKRAGWSVDAPHTESLSSGGVTFTLSVRPPSPEGARKGGAK